MPTAAASARRTSVRDTLRTSPPRPTSPMTAQWRDTARLLTVPAIASGHREVGPGIREAYAARDVDEHVQLGDGDAGALGEHREHEVEAVELIPRSGSSRELER